MAYKPTGDYLSYLSTIQYAINRMGQTSATIKSICIASFIAIASIAFTINFTSEPVCGIDFSFASNIWSILFISICCIGIAIGMMFLDAYYLSLERGYVLLYKIQAKSVYEFDVPAIKDYSMKPISRNDDYATLGIGQSFDIAFPEFKMEVFEKGKENMRIGKVLKSKSVLPFYLFCVLFSLLTGLIQIIVVFHFHYLG